ncbi:MAG: hypothetical protein A07HR60_00431 [uncultured archaeon A07HR60]|nr:MAG: hypothetical protein A07HR60_00431 [uncultured archaeon A07HR60]
MSRRTGVTHGTTCSPGSHNLISSRLVSSRLVSSRLVNECGEAHESTRGSADRAEVGVNSSRLGKLPSDIPLLLAGGGIKNGQSDRHRDIEQMIGVRLVCRIDAGSIFWARMVGQ